MVVHHSTIYRAATSLLVCALLCLPAALAQQSCASTTGLSYTTTNRILVGGKPINIKGVAWFGFEGPNFAPFGLDQNSLDNIMDILKANDINFIRLPFAADVIVSQRYPTNINGQQNPALVGKTSLEVMEAIVASAASHGIMVMPDMHLFDYTQGPSATQPPLWYSIRCNYDSSTSGDSVNGLCRTWQPACIGNRDGQCVDYTEEVFIGMWNTIVARMGKYWNFAAIDLMNEPHEPVTWGTGDMATDWAMAVERISNRIIAANPTWKGLIFAEGIANIRQGPSYCTNGTLPGATDGHWWGGNLEPARCRPIKLANNNDRLVYSPHVYGPSVFEQSYFANPNFPNNMPEIWNYHFRNALAFTGKPIVIGEWGGPTTGRSGQWLDKFVSYMNEAGLHDTIYWALNPNPGSDTPGLLNNWFGQTDANTAALLARMQPNPTLFAVNGNTVCFTPASSGSRPVDTSNIGAGTTGAPAGTPSSANDVCGRATESQGSLTMRCPSGTISAVQYASWGVPLGACGSEEYSWCHAQNSKSVVESACLGRASCTVSASNGGFGRDPCSGYAKALQVRVLCSSGGNGNSVTTGAPSSSSTTASSGSTCPVPYTRDLNGRQCWSLQAAPAAQTADQCAAAACAASSEAWQFCAPGGYCSPVNSCWIGSPSSCSENVDLNSGWVGKRRDANAPGQSAATTGQAPPASSSSSTTGSANTCAARFTADLTNRQCYGLTQAAGANTVEQCAQAACNANAPVYQFCRPGFACSPANSCWIGTPTVCDSTANSNSGWASRGMSDQNRPAGTGNGNGNGATTRSIAATTGAARPGTTTGAAATASSATTGSNNNNGGGCSIAISQSTSNSWSNGQSVNVVFTNRGSSPITSLRFSISPAPAQTWSVEKNADGTYSFPSWMTSFAPGQQFSWGYNSNQPSSYNTIRILTPAGC